MNRLLFAAKELKGIESPAELARLLNISDQVLTNWKSRGIPRKEIMDIAEAIGCNPYWLRDGNGLIRVVYAQDTEQELTLMAMRKMQKEEERYMVKIGNSLAEQAPDADTNRNGTQ